mgnify:CR=1 FL=1
MDLKEILSVTGRRGLFKTIAHTKTGLIVESLIDKKRIPVYPSDKISNLEDIFIFTTETEKPLKEVFRLIYDREQGGKTIDHKTDDIKLREYFEQILPDYDKDRVYTSDIRKVISWYNQLIANNLLDFSEKTEKKDEVSEEEELKKMPEEKTNINEDQKEQEE